MSYRCQVKRGLSINRALGANARRRCLSRQVRFGLPIANLEGVAFRTGHQGFVRGACRGGNGLFDSLGSGCTASVMSAVHARRGSTDGKAKRLCSYAYTSGAGIEPGTSRFNAAAGGETLEAGSGWLSRLPCFES